MALFLSEIQIHNLVAEPKPAVDDRALLAAMSPTANQQRRASIQVRGDHGSRFELHVRQNTRDPYDFSVILLCLPGGRPLILRRHNGPSHPHLNKLEGTRVDFVPHVHMATERYQAAGFNAEHYAVEAQDFGDLAGALRRMLSVASFRPTAQTTMDI